MQAKKTLIHIGLTFTFLFTVLFAYAAPVSENTARGIASRFAASFSSLRSTSPLTLVYTGEVNEGLRAGRDPLFYVYNVASDRGFVIVSGDDATYPVLGYATSGSFKTENMPDNLAYWLDFYKQEILYSIEQNITPSPEIKEEWQNLSYETKADVITPGLELPTAKWDQLEPYYNLCPLDDGELSVAGCVATSMAIVMHYHRWPERGTGSIEYTTRKKGISVSATFDTEYDWDNMLFEYLKVENVPTWTDQQAEAVAELMFHCGAAVEMDYKSTSSGAYTQYVIPALCEYFGYDNSSVLRLRGLYSTAEWEEMIKKELDENRPVIYGGSTYLNQGHQFVIDGYDQTAQYFHLNWGWSGSCDGYYRLSNLRPAQGGTGGVGAGLGYNYNQDAILGLQKAQEGSRINNEIYFIDYIPDGITTNKPKNTFGLYTDVEHIVKDEPFLFHFSFIYDYSMRDFSGEMALFLEDRNGNRKQKLVAMDMTEEGEQGIFEAGHVVWEEEGWELTITDEIEEGDMIRMYYKPEGYEWRAIRGESRVTQALPVYAESPVSNEAIRLEEAIQVFPTRVQTGLTISVPETIIIQSVSLYDLSGRLVKQEVIRSSDSKQYVSLSGQQPGIYILSIQTSQGTSRHKIIKE
ncbi:thiol protease/hemagglutinin PrtT [Parabacteroides sp. OttesenSCG-928-J18]|nr:thiol protease/hemagglutinin PrtT [Parabacteroides sp. OttesenSCG-928-J18]